MYRDRKIVIADPLFNHVMNNGALGDMISSLPATVFARQRYPTSALTLRVWVAPWQMDLVDHLLKPYGKFEIKNLLEFPLKKVEREDWDGGSIAFNGIWGDQHTRCRVHMVDYAFACLVNGRPESMEQRSYPTKAPIGPKVLEGKYVVFPVGATSDNKLFHASVMEPIMRWCIEHGYAPVIVGTKTSHTQTKIDGAMKPIVLRDQAGLISKETLEKCVDHREKTTLLELRDVLGHAAAVVGVDGGTLHLAGTTDVPIVFASGTTLPKHRYIPRHGSHTYKARYIGPRDLECYGCQSNWPMTTLHFTRCVYEDNACMQKLHPDDFIAGLKELGL